jgi:hypothetical protein
VHLTEGTLILEEEKYTKQELEDQEFPKEMDRI